MQRRVSTKGPILLFVLILSQLGSQARAAGAQPDDLRELREIRYVMGTLLDITLYHHDAKEARRLLDISFSLAQRLDDLLSNYKLQSEVNRLNQMAGAGTVKVSPELYDFLALTKELWKKTDRAFDVTVGAVMQLWKEAERKTVLPSPTALRKVLGLVGMHHVILYGNSEVNLTQRGMTIDTGGIGKGYAVDKIVKLLRDSGITTALINFGQSSIYALGAPPGNPAWNLLLQFPEQSPWGVVRLKDQALSASDTFGRSFEIRGKRYGHIVDPATGVPLGQRIQAVILTLSAADGEALSKYVILRNWKKEDQSSWQNARLLRRGGNGEFWCSENFSLPSRISGCQAF